MKKKTVALIALIIGMVAVFIIVCLNQKADTADTVIGTMDKKALEEKMIGAEPPRLLYADHDKAVFESTMIDADSELAPITSGYAVYLSESEYYYLTFENWKVNEINLVYVKDGKKTVYPVFDNMQK